MGNARCLWGLLYKFIYTLFSNSLRCPHPSWAFLFTWTISLSRLCLYYNRYSVVCQGAKGKFFEYYQEHLLEAIEPSLFYSNTTKPPGVERFSTKGIEPFLCILSKLTLQKLSLILYCNYRLTHIYPYVNRVIHLFLSLCHLCNTQHS